MGIDWGIKTMGAGCAVIGTDGNWRQSLDREGPLSGISRQLNRGWRWLSTRFFGILSPMMLGAVYFTLLTPIAVVLRWGRRDLLRLRFEPERRSYWVARTPVCGRQTSMRNQI